MNQADHIALLRDLHAFLVVDRDCLYDSVTNIDGIYDSDDDREAVEEADELINRVNSAIEDLENDMRRPDPLGEALNSGNGSYRP